MSRFRHPSYIWIWLITCLCLLAGSTETLAENAYMESLKLSYGEGYLRVTSNLVVSFTGKIREIILSGLDTVFIFEIRVRRRNDFWFNEIIFSREITHSIKYDTLKREYKVRLSEEDLPGTGTPKENITRDFQQVKKWMTTLSNVRTVTSWAIKQGEQYVVEVRGRMKAIDMPFPVDYLNFFMQFEEFETPWARQPMVYSANHGNE